MLHTVLFCYSRTAKQPSWFSFYFYRGLVSSRSSPQPLFRFSSLTTGKTRQVRTVGSDRQHWAGLKLGGQILTGRKNEFTLEVIENTRRIQKIFIKTAGFKCKLGSFTHKIILSYQRKSGLLWKQGHLH